MEQELKIIILILKDSNRLLEKLEGSKKASAKRQRSVEGRRDIFAGGLAGMMSNF